MKIGWLQRTLEISGIEIIEECLSSPEETARFVSFFLAKRPSCKDGCFFRLFSQYLTSACLLYIIILPSLMGGVKDGIRFFGGTARQRMQNKEEQCQAHGWIKLRRF